jgi:hypothetical protein
MIIEYKHAELGEDIQGRAGFYTAVEEFTMPYDGREVLYVMGTARLDRPCCGGACCWGYVQVPGFLVQRHISSQDSASPISRVEIVENENDRNQIRQALMKRHPGAQVEIWGTQYTQESSPQMSARPAG